MFVGLFAIYGTFKDQPSDPSPSSLPSSTNKPERVDLDEPTPRSQNQQPATTSTSGGNPTCELELAKLQIAELQKQLAQQPPSRPAPSAFSTPPEKTRVNQSPATGVTATKTMKQPPTVQTPGTETDEGPDDTTPIAKPGGKPVSWRALAPFRSGGLLIIIQFVISQPQS